MGQEISSKSMRLVASALVLAVSFLIQAFQASAGELLDEILGSNAHQAKGVQAYHAGNMAESAGHFGQALALRPGHSTLLYNLAAVRARMGDIDGALENLEKFAALGVFGSVAEDDDFASLQGNPEFEILKARIASHLTPVIASSVAFTTNRHLGLIEGIAYDKARDRFFLTSVSDGVIYEVSAADGIPHSYLTIADHKLWGLLGIAIDEQNDLMWVTSAALPQTFDAGHMMQGAGGAFAVDLKTDKITQSFRRLPIGLKHGFGDLTIDANGSVFITNSAAPQIFAVPNGVAEKAVAMNATDFYSAQGIVIAPQGGQLIVADYGMGLLSVKPRFDSVKRIDAPDGVNLIGIDGLHIYGDDLIAIQNGSNPNRVLRISMDRQWRRIKSVEVLEAAHPAYDEPTQGVVVGDELYYIANSGWPLYGDGTPDAEALANAKPLTVLKLPLN